MRRLAGSAAALAVLDRMEKIKTGEQIFYSPTNGRALSYAALAPSSIE